MKYQITQQYSQDDEQVLAEFCEMVDAKLFIEQKMAADKDQHLVLVYRLFQDQQLMQQYNKEKIKTPIYPAQYENGDRALPESFLNTFSLSNKETKTVAWAAFKNLIDAQNFIEHKVATDPHVTNKTSYCLFDQQRYLSEWNHDKITELKKQQEGGQAQASSISFNPSPLSNSPRPPGTPPPSVFDKPISLESENES